MTTSPRPFGRRFFVGALSGLTLSGLLLAGGAALDCDRDEVPAALRVLAPGSAWAGPADAPPAVAAPPALAGTQYSDVAEAVLPSVVSITAETTIPVPEWQGEMPEQFEDFMERFFGERGERFHGPRKQQGLGSGVIIDASGLVVTNHHVAGKADAITVTLHDGREYAAELVGTDQGTDIAVLQLLGEVKDLRPIRIGDSEKLRLGEVVMAVGNPFGFSGSVSLGIVSALGREGMGINEYERYIQTDAAINKGNSGGALVNMRGELVGIADAIYAPGGFMGMAGNVGIGFAIPTAMAMPVVEDLRRTGEVARGWLGVGIQDLDEDLAESFGAPGTDGVLVASVMDGAPAAQGGLEQGDIIVSVDGEQTRNTHSLKYAIGAAAPGHVAKLEILRDGKPKKLSVTLGRKPGPKEVVASAAEPEQEEKFGVDGVTVGRLDRAGKRRFGLGDEAQRGVLVMDVAPDSKAAESGLRAGDLVLEVNRKPVEDPKAFEKAMKQADKRALMLVQRGASTIYLSVKR